MYVLSGEWLTLMQPFPLNPSFKPPTPISDAVKTEIWNDFMADPAKSDVRHLAQRHGLSIARVDAILRLKGLEEHWRKVSSRGPELKSRRDVCRMSFKSISL